MVEDENGEDESSGGVDAEEVEGNSEEEVEDKEEEQDKEEDDNYEETQRLNLPCLLSPQHSLPTGVRSTTLVSDSRGVIQGIP